MPKTPDIVHISRLQVDLSASGKVITQYTHQPGSRVPPGRQPALVQETWRRGKQLGQGGYGTVWLEKCEDCTLGQKKGQIRVVKELQKLSNANYNRELEAVALFSYPQYRNHFVESFGWYETESCVFVTMEYLPHGDLQRYLTKPLPEAEGKAIVSQIVEALVDMHERGFAHRDLKPGNILVSEPGPNWWVKLADFGISKRAEADGTILRTQVYTPAFAAPEVLHLVATGGGDLGDDEPHYTNAVDVWALGMITLLILVGEVPFKDKRLRKSLLGKGTLPDEILSSQQISKDGLSFLVALLRRTPESRPSASECLGHQWLRSLDLGTLRSIERTTSLLQTSHRPDQIAKSMETSSGSSRSFTDAKPDGVTELIGDPAPWTTALSSDSSDETQRRPSSSRHKSLSLMDRVYWKEIARLKGHIGGNSCVAFSPDGKLLASASPYCGVKLWDTAAGIEVKGLARGGEDAFAVAFSADSKLVVSSSWTHGIKLWDVATELQLKQVGSNCKGHISDVAYSPDGELLAFTLQRTVRLWNVARNLEVAKLDGHKDKVNRVAFSPDGQLVASGSSDGTIRLWDVADKVQSARIYVGQVICAVAFSPDGRLIASISLGDEMIRLWNAATGASVATLHGHTQVAFAVAFSPDGRLIASSAGDGAIRLWNTATGAENATPIVVLEDPGLVHTLAFSPDSKRLASGSSDGIIRLWAPYVNGSQEIPTGL